MPRNGSGTYTLPTGINPVVTQTLITSNWANTTLTDVANALTNSVSTDGQSTMTGNLKMGGLQITGLGNPTTLSSAVSLGYVQTGAQFRLVNVSGVNAMTAVLAGGSTAFVVGQLTELIPPSTNSGPVTININGGGAMPVLSAQGLPLGATNLIAGSIYILAWDGAAWRVLIAPNANTFAQASVSGWDRPAGGTYPAITKVNANTVAIPAGKGRIIAANTRDQSGVIEVSWVAQNVALTNIPNAWTTTLAVNSVGAIVQLIGVIQAQWARQYILLATVAHIDGQIDGIVNQPAIYGDVAYEAFDLGVLFHNTITSGGQVVPSANTLHMDVNAGRMWLAGGNPNNANQPNFIDFANQIGITIYPTTAANVVAAATQAVPVTQYDPAGAGVVATIPDPITNTVIHRLFLLAGQYILCYGQTVYPDLATAIQSISNDNATFVPPGKLIGATLYAYVCANKGCTNLNDGVGGRIVGANAVSASSSGGGAGISEAPLDGNAYSRQNAGWFRSILLDATYNGMLGNNAKADGIFLALNATAASARVLRFQSSGLDRWSFTIDNSPESGGNVGSSILFARYADNGAYIDSPFRIDRKTGISLFSDPVNIAMPVSGDALSITNTNANGAIIKLVGDGIATPSKRIRVQGGEFQITNDANSTLILRLTDTGGLTIPGTFNASTVIATQANVSTISTTSTQGFQILWNVVQNGAGKNEYINNYGGGSGGHAFYSRSSTAGGPVLNFSIDANGIGAFKTQGQVYTLSLNDNGANGACLALIGGGSNPGKYIKAANGNLQFMNNAFSRVVTNMDDGGNWQTGVVTPLLDNTSNCGGAGVRWTSVWAVSGSIQTSDAREKTKVSMLTADELLAAKEIVELIGGYQFLDAIKKKGAKDARTHIGATVQSIMKVMEAHGLDPFKYGFVCYDEWEESTSHRVGDYTDIEGNFVPASEDIVTPAGNRYSLRPDELMMFLARGFDERLKAIEAQMRI